MKAISLWQPWASLIASGAKKIETRSWPTYYRGPLLIHAAKRKNKTEMDYLSYNDHYLSALNVGKRSEALSHLAQLPYGAIIAVVDLVDCKRVENIASDLLDERKFSMNYEYEQTGAWHSERYLGNYEAGRYGWILANPRPITPIDYKGEQGLFSVPDEIIKASV